MKSLSKKSIVAILFILMATVALSTGALADVQVVGEARIFNQEALQGETYTLATVPVVEFDIDTLALSMAALWVAADPLQYHLDQAAAGNKESCKEVVDLHVFVWSLSAVQVNVPAEYAKVNDDYLTALVDYFDSVNPAMESCFYSEQISNHEYGAARQGIDRARTILEPYFNGS